MKATNVNTLAVIASLGGFLFGYDTAVISGTIGFVTGQFGLDTINEGWYVSSALVGTIIGVSVAGILSDAYGRKNILILCGVFFGVSALGCMLAVGFTDLVLYRILGGIGVGVASMLSPLYISEIAPAEKRGRLVTLYQFAITIGILLAYFSNAFLLNLSTSESMANQTGVVGQVFATEVWRAMLGSEIFPALLFLVLLFFVPKSPRWLLKKGREEEARAILLTIGDEAHADKEIKEVERNLTMESGGLRMILNGGFRVALLMGMALALLAPLTGINAIIYYGPKILEEAGLQIGEALGGQVIIGIVNVGFTLIAIWKIDQIGRRPLLLTGVIGMVISLVTVGMLFFLEVNNTYLLMTFILIFIASFAFSFGPVIWVLLSEIYPLNIRGTAMSIATFVLWLGNVFVGQMTPWFLENLRPHGTFWFYALCSVPTVFIVLRVMPETKGKTLEEIENYWLSKSTHATQE
ncbi:MAG: sugar porter family MFS transporter [Bacteroidota bacterium]